MLNQNWEKQWRVGENDWFRVNHRVYHNGEYLTPHVDGGETGHSVHRLNIVLNKPRVGGKFSGQTIFNIFGRVYLFRPDIHIHGVTPVESGVRRVLIFSWFRMNNDNESCKLQKR